MNSALPSKRILPYFKDILVNAFSLQNYGFLSGCSEERVVPLNSEKCIQNLKKYFILSFFINQD